MSDQLWMATGEGEPAQEIAEVVGEHAEQQADLVRTEPVAGKARPVRRGFAPLDPLLGRPALVVEADDLVLIVLALFERLQDIIDNLHQKRSYRLRFSLDHLTQQDLDRMLQRSRVGFKLRQVIREAQTVNCWYDVWGDKTGLQELSDYFLNAEHILLVEYSA